MRTFREAMIVSNNLKAMKNLLEFIEANGGDPVQFVEWFTSDENFMEAGPAPSSNPAPNLTAGGSYLGQAIGQFVGGAAGLGSGMARGLAQTIGGAASGVAGVGGGAHGQFLARPAE